jgi:HemY protein
MADGIISAEWQPVSPVTGKLDAFQWATPGSLSDEDGPLLEDSLFDAPALPSATVAEPVRPVSDVEDSAVVLEVEPVTKTTDPKGSEPKSDEANAAGTDPEPTAVPVGKQGYEGTTDDVKFSPALKDLPDAAAAKAAPKKEAAPAKASATEAKPVTAAKTSSGAGEAAGKAQGHNGPETPPKTDAKGEDASKNAEAKSSSTKADEAKAGGAKPGDAKAGEAKSGETKSGGSKEDLNRPIEFPLSRMPDDPGPDEDDDSEASKTPRPRFFN